MNTVDLGVMTCGHQRQSFSAGLYAVEMPCADCVANGRAMSFPLTESFGQCADGGVKYWEVARNYVFERYPTRDGIRFRFEARR